MIPQGRGYKPGTLHDCNYFQIDRAIAPDHNRLHPRGVLWQLHPVLKQEREITSSSFWAKKEKFQPENKIIKEKKRI
jgi:hypothetical protein